LESQANCGGNNTANHFVELRVSLDKLERPVAVCYTGKPRQHGINNWEVFKAQIGGNRAVQHTLERISEVASAHAAWLLRSPIGRKQAASCAKMALPQAQSAYYLQQVQQDRSGRKAAKLHKLQ
jgi:hypothetical protein